MPNMFNRPQLPQAVMRFLGIKGAWTQEVEPTIINTIQLGDITRSPYLRYSIPGSESDTSPAVAGQLSYLGIRPGAQVCLAVKQIIIPATAAARSYSVRMLTFAQVAATITAAGPKLLDLTPEPGGLGQRLSSDLIIGVGAGGAFTGDGLFGLTVQANGQSMIYTFPEPGFVMYGNDPAGRGALVIQDGTANQDVHVGFVAHEWPLPG